MIFTTAV